MSRTRSEETNIIQTTDEMDNWLHPQTSERKQRIKDRTAAVTERLRNMKKEEVGIFRLPGEPTKHSYGAMVAQHVVRNRLSKKKMTQLYTLKSKNNKVWFVTRTRGNRPSSE
jgi:hypothetical protein